MSTHDRFSKTLDLETTSHSLQVRGQEVRVAIAAVKGQAYDRGDAVIIGEPRDDSFVMVYDCNHEVAVVSGATTAPDEYTQLQIAFEHMRQVGSGVLVYLDWHGRAYREARGNGRVAQARALHLVENEGISLEEAYQRLGLKDRLTYHNTRRLLQDGLGLSAIRLLVAQDDHPEFRKKMINDLKYRGRGLEVAPVYLEDVKERLVLPHATDAVDDSAVTPAVPSSQGDYQDKGPDIVSGPKRRRAARLRDLFRRARLSRG